MTGRVIDEGGAEPGLGADLDGAAEVLDDGAHDVEADAAAGGLGDLVAGREAGREEHLQQGAAGERRESAGSSAARDGDRRAAASSSTPRPSSDDLDDHGRAGGARRDGDGGLGRLAGVRAARPAVSQPWSTALVTRCRSESATASRTRVSSSTSWPASTSRTSLASAVARRRQLAHELGEAGDDAAQRDHRQAHRAVADGGEPALRRPRREPAARGRRRPAGRRGRRGRATRRAPAGRRPGRPAPLAQPRGPHAGGSAASAATLAAVAADPAYVELGLADDVEQVVHPSGRDADRVAAPGGRPSSRVREVLLARAGARRPGRRRRWRTSSAATTAARSSGPTGWSASRAATG